MVKAERPQRKAGWLPGVRVSKLCLGDVRGHLSGNQEAPHTHIGRPDRELQRSHTLGPNLCPGAPSLCPSPPNSLHSCSFVERLTFIL